MSIGWFLNSMLGVISCISIFILLKECQKILFSISVFIQIRPGAWCFDLEPMKWLRKTQVERSHQSLCNAGIYLIIFI
ncbi:unnamed protein product [Blepharisma stoltei]|uniref:Uncharacterized protein n=1 Tax=Blepharisma stoltei TaxID=1481888 RepID=A0AAU9IAI7_9CILI|nr:unnamed protein product [Blepharisma stoltei]